MSGLSDEPTLGATLGPAAGPSTSDAKPAPPLARGDALGRYLILDELGSGGMGKVYTAYDPELDRKLALKLLHREPEPSPSSATRSSAGSRLVREAQAMAQLSHRNVVAVHDVGVHDGRVFVAMEFVEGETLDAWMDRGPHPWRAVLDRFVAAGRGLAAAHAIDLIHRDFKPANVLLGRDGRVCVADFGLARRRDDPREDPREARLPQTDSATALEQSKTGSLSTRLTRTGAFVGTPAYMAPEQYDGAKLDARADQFSFCVALWEALWGERPFAGDSPAAIAFAIHLGKRREPSGDAPKVPTWLRRVVERGLAAKPEDRWPSMDALLTALTRDAALARRRVMTGLVALAGLAAAVFGPRLLAPATAPPPPPPPLCEGADAAFGDSLGPETRAEIEARYAEVAGEWAAGHEQRLAARLDDWAARWREAWTEACAATRILGQQSEAILDARMLCLGRRRTRFDTFVGALAEASDEQLRDAAAALDDIGDLRDCSDPELVHARVPPPADPERRAAYEAILAELDAVVALNAMGRFEPAKVRLIPAYYRALASGHPRLLAEAHYAYGRRHFYLDERAEAEAHMTRTYEHALAAGMFAEAGRAASTLAMLAAKDEGRRAEAGHWLRVAEALEAYSDDGGLRLMNLRNHARLLRFDGDPRAALPYYEAAIALATERYGPRSRQLGDHTFNLSTALMELGQVERALDQVAEARALWSDTLGPDDTRSLAALNAHGVIAWRKGELSVAAELFEELVERRTRVFGADNLSVAAAEFNLGAILANLADPRAVELLTRVRDRYAAENGPESIAALQCEANLAVAIARLRPRERDRALELIEGALAKIRAKREPSSPDVLTGYSIAVELHRYTGELDTAKALAAEQLELLDQLELPNVPMMVDTHTELATIHLLDGQPEQALAHAERAVELAADSVDASFPREVAERHTVMAEALAALGRDDEAAASIAIAREHFATLTKVAKTDELRARIARWDASNP